MASNDFLFTSESVSEGHPDKVADQISDAILDAIFKQDPVSRVAAETLTNTGLVVLAGLINNLLPLAQPGVAPRTVVKVALVVAMIFCISLLVSITAAHLYGVFFLKPPDPNTIMGKAALAALPFYLHPFVWSLAVIAAGLAAIITYMNKAAR